MTTLLTDRLRLRPWRPEDREPFAALNADAEVMEHFPRPLTRDESDHAAERIAALVDERGWGLWAVEVEGLSPFIGFIGLHAPRFQAHFTPALEIGWRLDRTAWGHGYATEGARAAAAFAFDVLHVREIVSFTVAANHRSTAVMRQIGMTHTPFDDFDHPAVTEPHLRHHVLYRLRADQLVRP